MMTNIELFQEQYRQDTGDIMAEFASSWAFGDDEAMADALAKLVVDGEKTATSSGYELYEIDNEPLPSVDGKLEIIEDGHGEPVAVIQLVDVRVVQYLEVPIAHAHDEVEGDKSLRYWRQVHYEFFKRVYYEAGLKFDPASAKVVLEKFKLVYATPLRKRV